MGKMPLPSISTLEDVVDILLKPEKYALYLTEFKRAHDEAESLLGLLVTKDLANEYLAVAYDKAEAAVKLLKESEDKASAMMSDAQQRLLDCDETISRSLSELQKSTEEHQERVAQHEKDVSHFHTYVNASRADLDAQKADSALRRLASYSATSTDSIACAAWVSAF